MKDAIFKVYKKCVLEIASNAYKPIRKRKYNLDYYLNCFTKLLTDINKWESLSSIYPNQNKYHWKTVYNEFQKWSKANIFKIAFEQFIQTNYFKHSKVRQNKKLNLFIDVTKIHNLKGCDGITINNEYVKKNITPITVVCDKDKLPLGMSILKPKTFYSNGRKTSSHDVTGVQDVLDSISLKIPSYVKCYVIGDKGYITQKTFVCNKQTVNMITPKRCNQKHKTNRLAKKKLKDRYKIENLFAKLKANDRINVRHDRKLVNYLSFMYISFLIEHIRYYDKM
jgi:transposase